MLQATRAAGCEHEKGLSAVWGAQQEGGRAGLVGVCGAVSFFLGLEGFSD